MNIDKLIKLCNERVDRYQMHYNLTNDHIEGLILLGQIDLLNNLITDLEQSR